MAARVRPSLAVGLLAAAYVVAFVSFEPVIGDAVLSLSVLPIAITAWLYGVRGGLAASAAFVVLNLTLMQTIGGANGFRVAQLPRIAVALAIGAAAGWVGDLVRRLRSLIEENARIDAALRASKQGLEQAVADRTAELVRANAALTAEVAARHQAILLAAAADRMAMVGTLTSGIGHEINNPLTVVMANLGFVSKTLASSDPAVVEAINDAQGAAERAAEIVQNMRGLVQSGAASGNADVKRAVTSMLRMVANEVRNRARIEVDVDDMPLVTLSSAQLGQLLLNLIINALQAMPQRDTNENLIAIRARLPAGARRVLIEISDTGAGIASDVIPRIFDPFFTTKPIGVGTGLGLWVCHRIVTEAGGAISVRSSKGKGTTFTIDLPIVEQAGDHAAPALRASASSRRLRVLAIDDDPAIRRTLVRLLGERHDVAVVDSARQALDAIAAGASYDAILCDVMMPAMTGKELCARLQAVAPDQADRVIFMTGASVSGQTEDILRDVGRRHVAKPFAADQLELALQEVGQRSR